jgi:hypothetical protein
MRSVALAILLCVGVASCDGTALPQSARGQTVVQIDMKQIGIDSVTELLHIRNYAGTVEFSNVRRQAALKIEVYNAGKKIELEQSVAIEGNVSPAVVIHKPTIEFAMQVVDLAYLPLGKGKTDHCRIRLKINIGGVRTENEIDVPKSEFDFSSVATSGSFEPSASSNDRVPLCYTVSEPRNHGNPWSIFSGHTPAELLQKNATSDIAILYLSFR